ncbi:MAG: 50S ribosomal protein L21 [Actinobacteria bacterium]|nr:50S ribosomal protein L21 [Actinomycetota bacterium]
MYAVIRHGGKQYKVAKGDTLVLDRLKGEVGSELELGEVLMVRNDDRVLTGADAAKAKITITILEHFKGDKVLVFKYKPKKDYHRTQGHRQLHTRVRIEDISLTKPAARKKAAKAEAPVEAPAPEGTPETKATAE